jgi:hypothetical protein
MACAYITFGVFSSTLQISRYSSVRLPNSSTVVEQFRERADGEFPTKEHYRRLSQLRQEVDV